MKRLVVSATTLMVLVAASASAQTAFTFMVAASGTPQEVQAVIDSHADANTNINGMTPLIIAATLNKSAKVVEILLKAGANIEAKDSQYGATALLWAAYDNPNIEVTEVLLKAGADMKAKGVYGRTSLMYAAMNNPNPEVILFLLEAGADPKAKDDMGKTALDLARTRAVLKETPALKRLEEVSE